MGSLRHNLLAVFFLTGCTTLVAGQPLAYSIELETQLRNGLFSGYQVLQRPAQDVFVTVELNLHYIKWLDIKSQTLSTSGYFSMQWTDLRLVWSTNSTYDNVRFLFTSERFMWRPSVAIENSNADLKVFSDPESLIRIIPNGRAVWNAGGIFETHCEADITYYPLDTQQCSIVLTTWAYTDLEITLVLALQPIVLDEFKENGEWEIISTESHSEVMSRGSDASNSYSRLYFTLNLKRRPLFHILNTLFPVILMALLTCFVFKLPPESGERVGMSLTVLLAYAVYLTLISENIPQTSLKASVLSTYLTIILLLSALSVMFTIVVLDIYFNHDDDEEPPSWIQTLTRSLLVKLFCWKSEALCKRRRVKPECGSTIMVLPKTPNENSSTAGTNSTIKKSSEHIEEEEDERKVYSWKEVALILDRCFMITFIFMVVGCTVVCVGILVSKS